MAERIKLYTDEHVPRAVVRGLRERGVDTLTVSEAGMLGANDEELLAFARSEGRVFFTQDDDFLRLHASGVKHAGIVYAQQPTTIGDVIYGLMLVIEVLDPAEMESHVEFLQKGPPSSPGGPMSEMVLRGQVPNGSRVIVEANDKSSEEINEEESIVDIKVTQPKEIVKAE